MNGWSPLMDTVIFLLPLVGMAFGWMVRSEKADRDCNRAYHKGYADAVKHYGR